MISSREKHARQSVLAFLKGKEELPWIKGVIRRSSIGTEAARLILTSWQGCGDSDRYEQLSEWLDTKGS
jgi:hypothetical protein